jgi:hypothetical protein
MIPTDHKCLTSIWLRTVSRKPHLPLIPTPLSIITALAVEFCFLLDEPSHSNLMRAVIRSSWLPRSKVQFRAQAGAATKSSACAKPFPLKMVQAISSSTD